MNAFNEAILAEFLFLKPNYALMLSNHKKLI